MLTWLIDALAAARLTRVVVEDSQHFPPLMPLRKAVDKRIVGTPWDALTSCPWCSSFWVGIGVVAARRFAPRPWRVVASVLAMSEVSGLLAHVEDS